MAFGFSALAAGPRVLAGLCVAASTFTAISVQAQGREWRYTPAYHQSAYHRVAYHYARRHWSYRASAYAPPFAAMVVDANSGRTLYAVAENELRHPASITKVMTLYLLFEQLEKGRMTLETPIEMSEHAASEAPSKLGLNPGESLSVDNAIKAIVTRSANDVAVAVAEKIGGDEETFAQMMTRTARALGMSRTVYRNASGLPDDGQITTAHDLSILARAIQERFPRYFHYFSTHSFEFAGETIASHDRLLGRVEGVDGIKTGYTRASGFNLMTSMHRGGRSLVAVVMGGASAASRDRIMEQLLYQHFAEASVGGRTARMIAEADEQGPVHVAAGAGGRTAPLAIAPVPPVRETAVGKGEDTAEGDDDEAAAQAQSSVPAPPPRAADRKHIDTDGAPTRASAPVATASASPAMGHGDGETAVYGSVGSPEAFGQTVKSRANVAETKIAAADAAALGWVKGPRSVVAAPTAGTASKSGETFAADASPPPPPSESRLDKGDNERGPSHDGWFVQIAATDDADKAIAMLNRAKSENRPMLATAKPFTEKVQKGDSTFYRARFAVLDSSAAEAACRSLKRTGFSCFAMHD